MRGKIPLSAVGTTVALLAVTAGPAAAATSWTSAGSVTINPIVESQGLATMDDATGASDHYTSVLTIPAAVSAEGWGHVGDPDGLSGYYIEPYESSSSGTKMYRLQSPDGTWSEYTHTLASGEAYNNSFDAIAPGGQWMVSGEWGTMSRLLVFPTPGLNSSTSPSQNLPLAATITLNRSVSNIQGCDFVTATQLVCASDDETGTLFGYTRPLLEIDLSAALTGVAVTGTVTALFQIPAVSSCSGTFEVEGDDYNAGSGVLTVLVIAPGTCVLTDSKAYRYTAA
jgi:hypothetical protein